MTTTATLEKFIGATKEVLMENFYADTWRSTSYLINILGKVQRYSESLAESNPGDDWYTAQIALNAATDMISGAYKCPTSDERFEDVRSMYESTVGLFIDEFSDDACYDMIYLGNICNFVAGMRVHAITTWIEETSPSEAKFEALRLAKRDAKAVELAIRTLADVVQKAVSN
jgi:hypothetical protein